MIKLREYIWDLHADVNHISEKLPVGAQFRGMYVDSPPRCVVVYFEYLADGMDETRYFQLINPQDEITSLRPKKGRVLKYLGSCVDDRPVQLFLLYEVTEI